MVSEQRIPLGSRVRIHGLQSPRGRLLNERYGLVIGYSAGHKRYRIALDDSDLTGLFSADNLCHEERQDGLTFQDLLGYWSD